MITYQYSKELDFGTSANVPSFTIFPIRVRKDDSLSQKASKKFVTRRKKAGLQFASPTSACQCPFGHIVSLVIPECPPDKVALATKLFEYTFIENDLLETFGSEEEKELEHAKSRLNRTDSDIRDEIIEEMLDIDNPIMSLMIVSYQKYLEAKQARGSGPSTFQEYIQWRVEHVGACILTTAVWIFMDIHADAKEMESIQHLIRPLEESFGLCNDYFSYDKERDDLMEGRGANAVAFLMQTERITEEKALERIKQNIISLETAHNAAFEASMKEGALSPELQRFILFLQSAMGGLHIYQATAGRYQTSADTKAHPDSISMRLVMNSVFVSVVALLLFLMFR